VGTPRGDDPATALGSHARTETVTTLTDELGWLIGALHLFQYRGVRPFLMLSLFWERPPAGLVTDTPPELMAGL